MKKNKFHYGIFIGRFQPFHLGHLRDVKKALDIVDFLIIIIGSAQEKRTERNPLHADERMKIIKAALTAEKIQKNKYVLCPIEDVGNHYIWVENIIKTAKKINNLVDNKAINNITKNNTLIFCGTEASGHFTAKLLAKKKYMVIKLRLLRGISGTKIRKLISAKKPWQHLVPKSVVSKISKCFNNNCF